LNHRIIIIIIVICILLIVAVVMQPTTLACCCLVPFEFSFQNVVFGRQDRVRVVVLQVLSSSMWPQPQPATTARSSSSSTTAVVVVVVVVVVLTTLWLVKLLFGHDANGDTKDGGAYRRHQT
jgi:preprotein translocase subunit SecG